MKKTRYTVTDKKILEDNIRDGVPVIKVQKLLPDRTMDAIVRQGQFLGYGVDTTVGIRHFVEGKGTRVAKVGIDSEDIATVDELEVTSNNFTSTVSDRISNKSDGSIALNEPSLLVTNQKVTEFLIGNGKYINSDDIKYLTDVLMRQKPA